MSDEGPDPWLGQELLEMAEWLEEQDARRNERELMELLESSNERTSQDQRQ